MHDSAGGAAMNDRQVHDIHAIRYDDHDLSVRMSSWI
jgi:hypothetical protein